MQAGIPERYGKYEVLRPLATGGMADLFLARSRGMHGFETLAVVKRIRPHLAANPEFVRLFLDEARLAAQLRHPNVVHVYDIGQERGEFRRDAHRLARADDRPRTASRPRELSRALRHL